MPSALEHSRRRAPLALSLAARLRLLALIVLAPLLVGGCSALLPPVRVAARTALLMPAFFAQLPIDPTAWGAPAVTRHDLGLGPDFPGALLHVYAPSSGRHPAFVISLGVDPAPPDDPRVVRLLTGFARSGYVAALVESPDLNAERLAPNEPDLIVRAYQMVAGEPFVDGRHVGLIGFSVGGSLVLIAAADPRIRGQLRLVEAFGSYDRLSSLMRAAVLHQLDANGKAVPWQPDDLTVEVLRLNLIGSLPLASDQALLKTAFPAAAPAAAEPDGLSPAGRSVFALLTATSSAQFAADYAALPAAQRRTFDTLSPASVVAQIQAPVYLMVDVGDPLVPYVESAQIDAQLRLAGRRPYFSEFDIFRHVDPTRGANPLIVARDLVRLFMHASAVLQAVGSRQ
jgi:hypothetical protein